MHQKGMKRDRKLMKKRLLWCAVALMLLAWMGYAVCSGAGYSASESAAAMMPGETAGGAAVFMPEEAQAGLVFYPGGLVDHAAYAPLMRALQDKGILCLLVEMPLDLAVLDMNAAEGLTALYPEIERWMIGGHSLGGAMAAAYAAAHPQEFDALLLLGAYAAEDLSGTEMAVLSVVGTEDGVLNREKYAQSMGHYPQRFMEVVLEGGCHAYFGDYGEQKGDGRATISRAEQIAATADAIERALHL